jgi:hypothetical protein
MRDSMLECPVVLIIFNRREHARAVLDVIGSARPRQLFVIADGPRAGRPEDVTRCAQTRALVERIDWACDLRTDFSAINLGAGRRIASGLDSVFEQVDRAIVLEDDCVPHPSFFPFCQELLDRYEDDERIRTIAGSNFLMGKARNGWSYHFSDFHALHGWGTWRRSWQRTDQSMRLWPEVRDNGWLIDICGSRRMARLWAARFDLVYRGELNAWDYPYILSCWMDHALALTPNVNLVQNIGFGAEATNTRFVADFCHRPTEAMQFPLVHPPFFIRDAVSDAEAVVQRLLPEEGSWLRRTARSLVSLATGRRRPRIAIRRARLLDRSGFEARPTPPATCQSARANRGRAAFDGRNGCAADLIAEQEDR